MRKPRLGQSGRMWVHPEVAARCQLVEGDIVVVAIRLIGMLAVDAVFGSSTRELIAAQVSANVRAVCDAHAVIERLAVGDFIVVLSSSGDDRRAVNRVLEAAGAPLTSPLGDVAVGFAAGVAVGDGRAPLQVIDRAACNLEAAAERGPGRFEWTVVRT